jgi:hypothetical protein
LIGGITFGCIGGLFGGASSATLEGAITGFFIGGWVFMEVSLLVSAVDVNKNENNEIDS